MIKIVFVPRRSTVRLYKIAKALRTLGQFELYCVCESTFYDKKLFADLFDNIYFYYNPSKILQKYPPLKHFYKNISSRYNFGFANLKETIELISPDLIQCFAEPYNHIEFILKNFKTPMVLVDGNDFSGISSGIENIKRSVRKQEKYCFENADGIMFKGPINTLDYYKEHQYKITGKELSWFDHTDEDLFKLNAQEKLSKKDGEIHLVYTGTISIDSTLMYCYYIPLGKILAKQGIHLHIYPTPLNYKKAKEYLNLDANEKYFHFHPPVAHKYLAHELAKYDWGLWVHSSDPSPRTQPSKTKIGMTNKLFSYLEAGLPVIVSDSRAYGKQFVEENRIGFSINDADWDKFGVKIDEFDHRTLVDKVLEVRMQYSLQKNGYRIAEFIENIINK